MKLIDADKLLEWLSTREGESYDNAAKTYSPSFFKGKAEAFKDVLDYVNIGHFDLTPPVQPDTPSTGTEILLKQQAKDKVNHIMKVYKDHMDRYQSIQPGDRVRHTVEKFNEGTGTVLVVRGSSATVVWDKSGMQGRPLLRCLEVIKDDQPTEKA